MRSKLKSIEEASVLKANEDKANAEASQKLLLDQIQTIIEEKSGPQDMIKYVKNTIKPASFKAGLPINPMKVGPKSIPLTTVPPIIKRNTFAGPVPSKLFFKIKRRL